jgi:hypothetical protein
MKIATILSAAAIVYGLAAYSANAASEGSCKPSSAVEATAKGSKLTQTEVCPDATSIQTYSCEKDAGKIEAILPLAFDDVKTGEMIKIQFTVSGEKLEKTLEVVAADEARISFQADDPLWVAISTLGSNIEASSKISATTVGLGEDAGDNLKSFKAACGL